MCILVARKCSTAPESTKLLQQELQTAGTYFFFFLAVWNNDMHNLLSLLCALAAVRLWL